jgi:hypothetical protein
MMGILGRISATGMSFLFADWTCTAVRLAAGVRLNPHTSVFV